MNIKKNKTPVKKTAAQKKPVKRTPAAKKTKQKSEKCVKTTKRASGKSRKPKSDLPDRDDPKNVQLPKIVGKVIGAIKEKLGGTKDPAEKPKRKPFGGKGGRKKKVPELSPEKQAQLEAIKNNSEDFDSEPRGCASGGMDRPENAFFYSNEKFFNQFEDEDITEEIRMAYPKYSPSEESDANIKKALFEMLQNEEFVSNLMEKYNMDIQEFFMYLIRKNQSIFSKQCISRVQRILKTKYYNGTAGL